MTTTYPDKLDRTFTRLGRIDCKVEPRNATTRQIQEVFKRMYSINSLPTKPSSLREMEDVEDLDSFPLPYCREFCQTNRYEIVQPEAPQGKFDKFSYLHLQYPYSSLSIWYLKLFYFVCPLKRTSVQTIVSSKTEAGQEDKSCRA
jgi:hypothetical protein